MDNNIKTYSKEWFVKNGTDKQKVAAESLKEKDLKNCKSTLSDTVFVGSVDDVKEKANNLPKTGPYTQGYLVNQVGIDNLISLLDADDDGEITSAEFNNLASVDMEEFDESTPTLKVSDLQAIYENVMDAKGARVYKTGPLTEVYTFKDGSSSFVSMDNTGNVTSKTTEAKTEDKKRITTSYNYLTKGKTEIVKDEKGRMVSSNITMPEKEFSKTTNIEYYEDGSKASVETTIGKVSTVVYDPQGKVTSSFVRPLYDSNGEIGSTYQQDIGDCWLLSGINALNTTSKGKEIIKDSIKHNKDGSVTITLKGVNKSYTYSAETIAMNAYSNQSKSFSKGDTDMNLIEKAVSDYRKSLTQQISFRGLSVKEEDPLSGGYNREAFYYLTGMKSENTYATFGTSSTEKILENKANNPDSYAITTSFRNDDKEFTEGTIITGHTYCVSRVDGDTVYLINPWDSSTEIPYPKDKYLKNTDGLSVINMDKYTK